MATPRSLSRKDRQSVAELEAYSGTMSTLSGFKPNPGGQQKFFRSPKHQIIGSGGNKGGKTFSGVVKGALNSIPEKDIHGNNTGYLILPEKMKEGGYAQRRLPSHPIQAFISSW